MVEVSNSERRERCWRASFPRKMRHIVVVGDPLISDDRSGSHPANTVFELSNQALVDVQVRTYGSVAILAASALLNYETIMQAAVATRQR